MSKTHAPMQFDIDDGAEVGGALAPAQQKIVDDLDNLPDGKLLGFHQVLAEVNCARSSLEKIPPSVKTVYSVRKHKAANRRLWGSATTIAAYREYYGIKSS